MKERDPEIQGTDGRKGHTNYVRKKRQEELVNWILIGISIFLTLLIAKDGFHIYYLKEQNKWNEKYVTAVQSSKGNWFLGWKIEEVRHKLHAQKQKMNDLSSILDDSLKSLYYNYLLSARKYLRINEDEDDGDGGVNLEKSKSKEKDNSRRDSNTKIEGREESRNEKRQRRYQDYLEDLAAKLAQSFDDMSNIYSFACAIRPEWPIVVGKWDFIDNTQDNECALASSASFRTINSPDTLFEVVSFPFPSGTGGIKDSFASTSRSTTTEQQSSPYRVVGFKSLSTGRYVKLIPPANGDYYGEWPMAVSSPLPGIAERFHLYNNGLIKSELSQGYLTCGGDLNSLHSSVHGLATSIDVNNDYELKEASTFILRKVDQVLVDKALQKKHLSDRLAKEYDTRIQEYENENSEILDSHRKRLLKKISFSKTATKDNNNSNNNDNDNNTRSNYYRIALLLPITSKGTDMNNVKQSPFWSNVFLSFLETVDWISPSVNFRFGFYLGFDYGDVLYDTGDTWSLLERYKNILIEDYISKQSYPTDVSDKLFNSIDLHLHHFDNFDNQPSQIVSQLGLKAYDDGFDYFYQINDDTIFVTPDWPQKLMSALITSPLLPNFGIAGPIDMNNRKVFTHSFFHRMHLEIFHYVFPACFNNWYSDDWITSVYGRQATNRIFDVLIVHNKESQKKEQVQRYQIHHEAERLLHEEILQGKVKINNFLNGPREQHATPNDIRDEVGAIPSLPFPLVCNYSPLVSLLFDETVL